MTLLRIHLHIIIYSLPPYASHPKAQRSFNRSAATPCLLNFHSKSRRVSASLSATLNRPARHLNSLDKFTSGPSHRTYRHSFKAHHSRDESTHSPYYDAGTVPCSLAERTASTTRDIPRSLLLSNSGSTIFLFVERTKFAQRH